MNFQSSGSLAQRSGKVEAASPKGAAHGRTAARPPPGRSVTRAQKLAGHRAKKRAPQVREGGGTGEIRGLYAERVFWVVKSSQLSGTAGLYME